MSEAELRSNAGAQTRSKRHLSENPEPLDEVSNPHQWSDETRTSYREIIANNPWPVLGALILSVFAMIALYFIAGNFAVTVITDQWTLRIVAASTIAIGAYVTGRSSQQEVIEKTDWLVLKTPSGIMEYPGKLEPGADGDDPVFTPHKGFTRLGNLSDEYDLSEFSPELARSRGHELEEDPVVKIRLNPHYVGVDTTARGRVVCQLSAGLELDPDARNTHLYAELPSMAEEGVLDDLNDELAESQARINNLEKQNDTLRDQRDQALELAKESTEETIDWFVTKISHLERARRSTSTRSETGSNGSPAETFDDIEDELAPDN